MWRCHIILLIVGVVLLGPFFHDTCAGRSVSMQVACGTCHTMHNSDANFEVVPGGLGPLPALTNNTCVGCHTGSNAVDSTPFVFSTTLPSPLYNPGSGATHGTLAGGSFYWVSQGSNDLKGHNVQGVVASQASRTPPGGSKTFDAETPLTCAGKNGCHGDPDPLIDTQIESIWGSHHGPTPGTDYRYLKGIIGVEDSDWEYSLVAADDHNQYKGKSRTGDNDLADNESSISHLCAKCHGAFHSGAYPDGVSNAGFAFPNPWVRHPVDFDMGKVAGAGSEYADYGEEVVAGAYKFSTPLADINATVALGTVTLDGVGDGTAIITCITCHRAHGSPYDYSLRWNYQGWPSAVPYQGGCPDCHTVKD